jgi:type VI protein secretion system component VasK
MNPPEKVFDAEGQPYRRREDDADDAVLRGWALWAQVMFLHRGKVLFLVSAATWALTTAGFKYVGPSQEIQRVERKVDTLAQRVGRMEQTQAEARAEREELKRSMGWVIYMQCRQAKRVDPSDLPPICDQGKP